MTIRYSICHNDDDPTDPNHRRIEIGVVDSAERGKLIIVADGEPVDMAPLCNSEDQAAKVIRSLWGIPYWDLQDEVKG